MTRHDLSYTHPAKASWQETAAHALNGTDAAVPDPNEASTHQLCCVFRSECRPPGCYASPPTDGRGTPRNGTDPKSP